MTQPDYTVVKLSQWTVPTESLPSASIWADNQEPPNILRKLKINKKILEETDIRYEEKNL